MLFSLNRSVIFCVILFKTPINLLKSNRVFIMRKLSLVFFCVTLLNLSTSFADDDPFVRYPSLNSDGSLLAFSFQGDIWVVPTEGGKAERLTIHEAYDSRPFWSRDDEYIAFSSDRFGNNDVFLMSSKGGVPERLTFHSQNDDINDFTTDDDIVFQTRRVFRQVEWDDEFYSVNKDGGTPHRILNSTGDFPSVSPNGKFIAFSLGWGRQTREAYRGSANYDIWIYNTETNEYKKLTDFDGHDVYPRWGDDHTMYYISAKSGTYNVYSFSIDDNGNKVGDEKQLTDWDDDGVRYLTISADGSTIAMERQTNAYVMKTSGELPQKVDIEIAADYRFDPVERKTYTNNLSDYAVSPNGKYSALVIRGEIFITENDKDRSKAVNVTNHPYRDQHVTWLSDTTLIFTSDRDGQFDLYMLKSSDPNETDLFKSFFHAAIKIADSDGEELWPKVSPDGKKISYEVGEGKLIVADISANGTLSNKVTLLDGWDAPGNVRWSPDSKWLAYSLDDLSFNEDIFIQPADGSMKPVNVSMHPRGDSSPYWSKDGKKLAFVSQRNNNDGDIWFAWLNKKDWQKTKRDWEEDDEEKDEKDKDSSDSKPIVIDLEDIHERLQQVTSMPGEEYSPLISEDGETFFFVGTNNTERGTDLFSVKWDGSEIKQLTRGGQSPMQLNFDKDYKHIYTIRKGKLSRFDDKGGNEEGIPYSANLVIDHTVERNQIFEEAWRALRDGFYDPYFHGRDWSALKEKYKPWCMKASTQNDFAYMFNWLLGELNASHLGMRNVQERTETQHDRTGLLGVELIPVSDGVKITHVVPDSPADRESSKLNAGDVITTINGKRVTNGINFYSLLINTVDEKVLLQVEDKNGDNRKVVVRPTNSLSQELYEEWVDQRKELVDKYSHGRIGYLHIRAMGIPSFERFERELTARGYGKEGIVIDVRFNGGGRTADYLMTVLNYKQHAYTIPRGSAENPNKTRKEFRQYYPLGERLPYAAWIKPSIALCNKNSYSNAEIFAHAYKNLGIGKLVGTPTFGAVLSTGAHFLIDGSYVRMPFRGWYILRTDENMDFVPAVPDIIVENPPDAKARGEDPQLKRAVDELLKELDSK